MNYALNKRSGLRKYADHVLDHLKIEVKSNRYATKDVQGWLTECGYEDVSYTEATNIRYRLLNDLPFKSYLKSPPSEQGKIEDFLHNTDLSNEIIAGGIESINNLRTVHEGLSKQIKGYDYRMSTDCQKRFSATAWQTGRMRARLKAKGAVIFADDSRSGINTSGFCFWNIMILNQDRKAFCVMGAMTMDASNDAVEWILGSMVSMCPQASEVVQKTMSDLALGVSSIKKSLPNVDLCAVCTWHIMVIDFPKNLKHIPDYDNCKNYVYEKLVRNTVCKTEWDDHLTYCCRNWPAAAGYMQRLARCRDRLGAPWRLEHFTVGMEASSIVEGSFSAFHRFLDGIPHSFAGTVQQHVKKDNDKHAEERRDFVRANLLPFDEKVRDERSDAANECSDFFSHKITDRFSETNLEAQNYSNDALGNLTDEQLARGVTGSWKVYHRSIGDSKSRIVEEIDGKWFCSCHMDINTGEPCRHIQCVL